MASDDSVFPTGGNPQTPVMGDGASPGETIFGHFLVRRRADGALWELGRGAMGVTYRAFDTSLQTEVALKVIRAERVAEDSARRRFQREARAAARIRHPNIANVVYLGEQDGEFFYAMEFLEGRSLEDFLKERGTTLPPGEALALAAQAAAGLNAAHRQEVVHRDLKPSNLMLLEGASLDHTDERTRAAGNRLLKVIDFGLARSFGGERQDESLVTQSMTGFIGTPAYASPEQGMGADDLDGRADLYSLGVILWQMLCGRLPFSGRVIEILSKHQLQPPPFEQLANVPPPLVDLLAGLLEKDPAARRPQTAGELRDLLDGWLHDPSRQAVPAATGSTQEFALEPRPPTVVSVPPREARVEPAAILRTVPVSPVPPPPPPPPADGQRLLNRQSLLLLVCAFLCLLVGAGVMLVWNLRPPPAVAVVPPSVPAASPPVAAAEPAAPPAVPVAPLSPAVVLATPSPTMLAADRTPAAAPRLEEARTSAASLPPPALATPAMVFRQARIERAPVSREPGEPTDPKRRALARAQESDRVMNAVYSAGRTRLDANGKNAWKQAQNDWLRARSAQTGGPEMLSRGMSADLGDMRRFAELDEARTEFLRSNMGPRY